MRDFTLPVDQRDALLDITDMLAWLNYTAYRALALGPNEDRPDTAEAHGYFLLASRCTDDISHMLTALTTPPEPYMQGR